MRSGLLVALATLIVAIGRFDVVYQMRTRSSGVR